MRLLVTRRLTDAAMDAIRAHFDTDVIDTGPLDQAAAIRALADYDAILPTLGDQFTAAAFAASPPRCKLLANFGVGYNHINVIAARAAGVNVTNTPGAVTEPTADIAMTLLLMTARRAGEGERLVRAGRWTGWTPTQLLGTHVTGKTVGIIGMGRIGKAIAARCHFGFGMQVLFFNRSQVPAPGVPARQVDDLHQMLRDCDFAVLAVPASAATRHLIGVAELDALGPRGFLINVARGDVVDEAALIAALQSARIAGAGLDVYEHEPTVPQALIALENVTLLPHLGTAAEDVRTAMALRALDNLAAFAQGQPLPDLVN
ncbi:MAG: D-glycerate dehydrogenase [Paracoccus sp. (in: a-proteobacteria)]|uniref:2-hydroxyacid dehydrogenase n=1 Tax=Paracoccus sp. TaxID=267 RepID=UPI0026E0B680|nr:D-glycerate dehydrogenase [Paracoccus sp. (in: a-proteobacteria)]MDO5630766.1 D-glycerate dehydrogenase [Paracoccus sp. (in: a-proteobacteria)]